MCLDKSIVTALIVLVMIWIYKQIKKRVLLEICKANPASTSGIEAERR
ncbi:MAG: hypothetical protein ACJASL_004359 [Paraglaciecola sp.]|jgi:hypothetical protein